MLAIRNTSVGHTQLKEITTKIGSGATPRGGRNSYKSEGISLVRSLNVYDFKFDSVGLAFIDQDQANSLSNVVVRSRDILLNITGASVARCCMVPDLILPARVNQHVAIVRIDESKADPYYVLCCINSPRYKSQLLAIAQGGATREALTKEKIENFEIPSPDLRVQNKIAAILSAYEDLIGNNLRRIKILEEMAQAIYREWFVKFRFPGHENVKMVDSELGEIPEGWEIVRVKQLIKRLPKGKVYRKEDIEESGEVIVVDQSRSEFIGFHNNEPDFNASPTKPFPIFGDHTCKMQLMVEPFSVGPNVVPFEAAEGLPLHFVYHLVSGLVETKEYKRHWNELMAREIILAEVGTAKAFSDIIEPLLADMNILRRVNLVLGRIRDLLLPKLISGKLDVSDLNINVDQESL